MRVSGLVFAGGLLKAVTLLGALKSFEEATGGLPDLRVLAGSSSGAILAAMVATGWSADEISDYLINDLKIVGDLLRHNPLQLNKLSLLWKLIRGRGLDDGTLLHETLGKMLARHASQDITFAEVASRFGHDLVVTGSCYTGCEGLVLFSTKTTPNMPVRTALRASAAYPGLMLPADIDGRVHYDGGLTCNFPLHAVQEQYPDLRDAIYGFTFDFSRRNDVAHAWVKDEWPGITDVMVNVVSLMYFRIAQLEQKLTYRYDDFCVSIPVDCDDEAAVATTTKEHHTPEKLFHLSADAPAMRRMYSHGLAFTDAWLRKHSRAMASSSRHRPDSVSAPTSAVPPSDRTGP